MNICIKRGEKIVGMLREIEYFSTEETVINLDEKLRELGFLTEDDEIFVTEDINNSDEHSTSQVQSDP